VEKLLRGLAEFLRTRRTAYVASWAHLAQGQTPGLLTITCSDSRLSPVEFTGAEPGDAFSVRNVGNIVPPYDAAVRLAPSAGAAIEYALAVLPIEDIVVCGHSACGAIRAIASGRIPAGSPHLAAWLDHGRRSLEGIPPAPPGLGEQDHLSQQNVLRQLDNLRTYPAVRDGERAGRLRLTAWWFDIANAVVFDHDPALGRFDPLDEARIARLLANRAHGAGGGTG
jgi:carbonic anhydrase